MNTLRLVIPGIPKPKQSARFRIVNKQYISSYQTKEIKDNERSIKLIIKEQLPEGFLPISEKLFISKLHYVFPPISSLNKKTMELIKRNEIVYKSTKPDLTDNLSKGLFDAMQGVVFMNDSQICSMDNVKKYYGLEPRIEIEITYN